MSNIPTGATIYCSIDNFCYRVYALLAVSGLLSYIEDSLSMYLAPQTLKMLYHSGVHCMLIGMISGAENGYLLGSG